MKNWEVLSKNPLSYSLANNGVSKVTEVAGDSQQLKTLRFELETFVCDGEYARGLERALSAYLDGLGKTEQQAVWVSGFFGSGKSHLVKMLRYLWDDFQFPDGASARSIVHLPDAVRDLFVELTNRSRHYGGMTAASGTLGAGAMDNVRLAFLQLLFRAAGLPENYSAARFVLWLREKQFLEKVLSTLSERKLDPEREFKNFFVSIPLAEALVSADPKYGTPQNAQEAIRWQFPISDSPTIEDTLSLIRRMFGDGTKLPCTLIVVDEVQQYIGDKIQRAMDVQEIAEHCCSKLDSRLLFVGTGQSALTGTQSLGRLQARFTVKVSLSDTDVETVIRKTVLAKKPERVADIRKVVESNHGEISRQLQNTRLAATTADDPFYASDYPLLPVRRRFWEKVLRNVDASGTTAQLRTQLNIVFEAARETAERNLGHVIPADFIYDQISTDLLNTGILQREYHETIVGLRDGARAGTLKSRLCAAAFLISKLSRSPGADEGVRATQEILADLLVEDLRKDGAILRQEVPKLLDELVSQGKLMQVESEYLLQTRESSAWNHDFNSRRARIVNDESRLGSEREEMLKTAATEALRRLSLTQGVSRQARDIEIVFSAACPRQPEQELVLWMRHGWAEQVKTIENDARAAGTSSPMLLGFLPRAKHEDFKEHLASYLAARETLDTHGSPTGEEGIQAQNAIKTRQQIAEQGLAGCLKDILSGGRIFLGGGAEAAGTQLPDKAKDAAESALQRLFPEFNDADHANWPQVLSAARAGNIGALQAVGHQGEVVKHEVCRKICDFIGSGKKGREVREKFKAKPYGWPQDAIDASLVILTLAGNLRAIINGQPVTATSLNQTQIGSAAFAVDVPPLSVTQRLELKGLFQKLGTATQSGKESEAASVFLARLLELADAAGGEPPMPERPDVQSIRALQSQSGNAQLLAIHGQKDGLAADVVSWTAIKEKIGRKKPRWERLCELQEPAAGLPESSDVRASVDGLRAARALLHEPDAVPPLILKLLDSLRRALNAWQAELDGTFERETGRLEENPAWQSLAESQREQLVIQFNLRPPAKVKVTAEEDIVAALRENSLANRRTLLDALPQRFQRAIEEAARLLEPKIARVELPSATIRNAEDLEKWLAESRTRIADQLSKGPVMV